jgi:hypothetical protein
MELIKMKYIKLIAKEGYYYQAGTEVFDYDGNRFTKEEWQKCIEEDCFLCRGLNSDGKWDGEQCLLEEFLIEEVDQPFSCY